MIQRGGLPSATGRLTCAETLQQRSVVSLGFILPSSWGACSYVSGPSQTGTNSPQEYRPIVPRSCLRPKIRVGDLIDQPILAPQTVAPTITPANQRRSNPLPESLAITGTDMTIPSNFILSNQETTPGALERIQLCKRPTVLHRTFAPIEFGESTINRGQCLSMEFPESPTIDQEVLLALTTLV